MSLKPDAAAEAASAAAYWKQRALRAESALSPSMDAVEAIAWLFTAKKPGQACELASISDQGTELIPFNEWRTIKRTPLVEGGPAELIYEGDSKSSTGPRGWADSGVAMRDSAGDAVEALRELVALALHGLTYMYERKTRVETLRAEERASPRDVRSAQAAYDDAKRTLDRARAVLAAAPGPSPLEALIAAHARELEQNAYAYFELAYTRRTGWMAWITDKPASGELGTAEYARSRKVIARGQGDTPNEAAADALSAMSAGSTSGTQETP